MRGTQVRGTLVRKVPCCVKGTQIYDRDPGEGLPDEGDPGEKWNWKELLSMGSEAWLSHATPTCARCQSGRELVQHPQDDGGVDVPLGKTLIFSYRPRCSWTPSSRGHLPIPGIKLGAPIPN